MLDYKGFLIFSQETKLKVESKFFCATICYHLLPFAFKRWGKFDEMEDYEIDRTEKFFI